MTGIISIIRNLWRRIRTGPQSYVYVDLEVLRYIKT